MIGCLITNTHILFGEWTSVNEKYILHDLKYIPLFKPIKEVFKSADDSSEVLRKAINKLSFKGDKIVIAIDDDLLYHSNTNNSESLSDNELLDFIKWKTQQRFGELNSFYTTFTERFSSKSTIFHSITCPSLLIEGIKNITRDIGLKAIWIGPISSIFTNFYKIPKVIFLTTEKSYVNYFYHNSRGYNRGKLRFNNGKPTFVGNDDNNEINSTKSKYVFIDGSSKKYQKDLGKLKYHNVTPFDGIDVNINNIPPTIPQILLNTFSLMITIFTFDELVNFLGTEKIQKYSHSSENQSTAKKEPNKKQTEQSKVPIEKDVIIKTTSLKKEKKRTNIFPFVLIVLFGILGYYLLTNNNGKTLLTELNNKFRPQESVDYPTKLNSYEQDFYQSVALLEMFDAITTQINPDNLVTLKLFDDSGSVAFVEDDSLNIRNLITKNYSVEPINCCNGIKQTIEFDIATLPSNKSNIYTDTETVLEQLNQSLNVNNIRTLSVKSINNLKFSPIIFEVKSFQQIKNITSYISNAGDNLIVRKIDIRNEPGFNNHTAAFFIAVYDKI